MTPPPSKLLLYRAILNAIPSPIFVLEGDMKVADFNTAAGEVLYLNRKAAINKKAGDVLHCVNALAVNGGCGANSRCADCLIRSSIQESFLGRKIIRQKVRMQRVIKNATVVSTLLVSTSPIQENGHEYVLLVIEDMGEIECLRQLLPICSRCKKIRDDKDYWHSAEEYFEKYMEIDFSHHLCPDCIEKQYPLR